MKPIFKMIMVIFLVSCDDNRTTKKHFPLADDFLLNDYNPVPVMLLGTWHYLNMGLNFEFISNLFTIVLY